MTSTTIHASAVLVGARAVLIRGPAGAGKSRLAFALIEAAQAGTLRFAALVGDDRVHLEGVHGRVLVRPAEGLGGLIEVRGLGIRRLPFEPLAVVGLVVDLEVAEGERLPPAARADGRGRHPAAAACRRSRRRPRADSGHTTDGGLILPGSVMRRERQPGNLEHSP